MGCQTILKADTLTTVLFPPDTDIGYHNANLFSFFLGLCSWYVPEPNFLGRYVLVKDKILKAASSGIWLTCPKLGAKSLEQPGGYFSEKCGLLFSFLVVIFERLELMFFTYFSNLLFTIFVQCLPLYCYGV